MFTSYGAKGLKVSLFDRVAHTCIYDSVCNNAITT